MPRNYRLYLNDILKALERIELLLKEVDEASFKNNDVRVDGILFNLMTIGEAVKNIPDEMKMQASQLPWRDISRFRDRVVHHYFALDLNIIWEVITVHLPALKNAIETLSENFSDDDGVEEAD